MAAVKVELLVCDYGRMIGLSRYAQSLVAALSKNHIEMTLVSPVLPWPVRLAHPLLTKFGMDVKTFFTTYPLKARFTRSALKHFTAQQMASLLWLQPGLQPAVVTVHDIVPYLMRGDENQDTARHFVDRYVDRQAMMALKKADAIISVSDTTKMTLVDHLGCSEERIFVIYSGVDHALFRQVPVSEEFLDHYGLDGERKYVLYVGSDNPRKNLPRVIQAYVQVKKVHPEVHLIKVGTSESPVHARQHRQMIVELGLESSVHWFGQVPEEHLPMFYNLAQVFVFPSLYEGFGLPVLEAMACGTPVVTSNASSLPEVAGEAALLVDPLDAGGIAAAVGRILDDPTLAADLVRRGLERSAGFTWERTARQTIEVYERVINAS